MSVGRFFRTVRYLSGEQIAFSVIRRLRHEAWRRSSQIRGRIAGAALALPVSDMTRPPMAAIADNVFDLQSALNGGTLDGLRAGRLSLLGEELDIGAWKDFQWRADRGEGNSPLRRLTLAYFGWAVPLLATGRADDLERVSAALASLDAVPWNDAGVFLDLWNPYTASHRLINLAAGLNRHVRAGGNPAAVERLHRHIRFCAAFIAADPERDLQANHLLKNWTALAVFAATTSDPSRTFRFLPRRIIRSLSQLVLDDGGHAERSPMYHALAVSDVDLIRASGAVPTLAAPLEDIVGRLRRALVVLTHPDGDIALFNDSWIGGAPKPSILAVPAAPPGASALPDTGYVRLGAEAEAAIFDCGPCGLDLQPGHAHADFLSVEVSLAATRFIVDPGTPTYTAGPLRDRSRSAAVHNGPHIEGSEPIEFWKSFRVGRRAQAGGLYCKDLAQAPLWCAGWHDGYRQQGVEPRRWMGLWPGRGLLVIDLWIGATAVPARTLFLVPGPWIAGAAEGALAFDGPARVRVEALAGHLEVGRAVWWPRYGSEEPATSLRLRPAENTSPTTAVLFSWGDRITIEPDLPAVVARALSGAEKGPPAGHRA
jgi:hypothetical protein